MVELASPAVSQPFSQQTSPARILPEGVTTLAGTPGVKGYRDGRSGAALFNDPTTIALDTLGTLYVAEWSNHLIRKITPAGEVMTLAGTLGSAGYRDGPVATARFNGPVGVAVDAAGVVYVADYNNHVIRKVTPAGEVLTLAGTPGAAGSVNGAAGTARFNGPVGVAVDAAGMVYVAERDGHVIRKVTPAGEVQTLAGAPGVAGHVNGAAGAARFNGPYGIAVDAEGNLYVAEYASHVIRKVTPRGRVQTLAGTPGTAGHRDGSTRAARFSSPLGVAVDTAGMIYVTDTSNQVIRRLTPNGQVSTLAGVPGQAGHRDGPATAARFNSPRGIAVDATGTLYVTEFGDNAVLRRIVPVSAAASPLPSA